MAMAGGPPVIPAEGGAPIGAIWVGGGAMAAPNEGAGGEAAAPIGGGDAIPMPEPPWALYIIGGAPAGGAACGAC